MGEIGQAEGWLVLAQVQSVMPQHFTTLMCQEHISFWMLWHELLSPTAEFLPHIASIPYGIISLTTQQPFTGYCCAAGSGHTGWRKLHIHMHDELLMRQGSEKTISPQRHSPFFFSSHSAALSLFPFPSIPRGMEILTRTNFYCIGRQSASKWWKPVHDLS